MAHCEFLFELNKLKSMYFSGGGLLIEHDGTTEPISVAIESRNLSVRPPSANEGVAICSAMKFSLDSVAQIDVELIMGDFMMAKVTFNPEHE